MPSAPEMPTTTTAAQSAQLALATCAGIGQWLAEYGLGWREFEDVRAAAVAEKQLKETPWCLYPMGLVSDVLRFYGVSSAQIGRQCATVAALAEWRLSQRVYALDPAVLDALWWSEVSGQLPTDVLLRLPDWCVYVHLPGRQSHHHGSQRIISGAPSSTGFEVTELEGAWVWLEADPEGPELRVLLLTRQPSIIDAGVVSLSEPTLEAGALKSARKYVALAREEGLSIEDEQTVAKYWIAAIEPLLSIALYLCVAPDVPRVARPPQKAGPRKPPKAGPEIVRAGIELGAALRSAPLVVGSEAPTGEGSHRSPRPHLRRAHWHTYLAGPGRESRVVRWIHPTLVRGGASNPSVRRAEARPPSSPQAALSAWDGYTQAEPFSTYRGMQSSSGLSHLESYDESDEN